MFEELARAGFAVAPGEDAGLSRRIDDPIRGGKGVNIAGHAEVAMHEIDAEPFQRQAIGFASLAGEIVEAHDLDSLVRVEQIASQVAASEAANA